MIKKCKFNDLTIYYNKRGLETSAKAPGDIIPWEKITYKYSKNGNVTVAYLTTGDKDGNTYDLKIVYKYDRKYKVPARKHAAWINEFSSTYGCNVIFSDITGNTL